MLVLIVGYLVQQTGATLITIVALLALTVPFVLQARWRRPAVIRAGRHRADGYHHPDEGDTADAFPRAG